jgi:hypothetical protein
MLLTPAFVAAPWQHMATLDAMSNRLSIADIKAQEAADRDVVRAAFAVSSSRRFSTASCRHFSRPYGHRTALTAASVALIGT